MKQTKRRILTFLLAVCTLCGCLLPAVLPMAATAVDYPNTYRNTGNQRQDLIGVGLTQFGYTEGTNNNTKYGSWYSTPNQPWCATFVSWCIAQAELPREVVKQSCISDPTAEYFNIPYYDGAEYTPQPGDLFFSRIFGHVGIVHYVEGDYFYTIEGNTNVHDPDATNAVVLEGLYVMTNKRRIKDYIFGVPNYQGDGKEHSYKKCYESAHPHKIYYECTTCGYSYKTNSNYLVPTCTKCIPCDCYNTTSGYYVADIPFERLGMGDKHGESYRTPSTVPDGTIVYVYGYKDGWALINHDNVIGHLPSYYLKPVDPVPATPTVTADSNEYVQKDTGTFSWKAVSGAKSYQVRVYKDCTLLVEKNVGTATSYSLKNMDPGKYEVQVAALNSTGFSEAGRVQFQVRDVYRVKFDWVGGYNGPETQVQTLREVMILPDVLPTYPNYTCLGWTDVKGSNFVVYRPGDSFISDKDVTLYAVWKKDSATLKKLSIERLPAQTRYLKGDTLDTEGLTLRLDYSDGSGELTTKGYTVEGFSSDTLGTKTVTVTYGDKTVTFDVQIMTYIPGDVNEDRLVDRDDVMQLLWHISFPEKFPINVNADFKEDGKVNRDDVMQLLWHVAFPDKFSVPDANTHTHKWTAATCNEPKFCKTCGITEGNAAGHTWTAATCTAPKTCSVCGATEGEAAGHAWNEATCTAPKTCSVCGATEGEAAGHAWNEATCTTPKTCSVCGATEGEAAGHAWNEATCTTPKTCSVCGATEGEAAGHAWNEATCTAPKTCSTCGATEGDVSHDYVENADGSITCSRCGVAQSPVVPPED